MTKYETFPNAPITEAILEIMVDLPKEFPVENLLKFPKPIKIRFQKLITKRYFQAKFNFRGDVTVLPDEQKVLGYELHSDEEKKVLQSRLDGFAFSKLGSYYGWDSFHSEARELWEYYALVTQPSKIVRISLRYVNRIELPRHMEKFDEYIRTNPQIAPDLPQGVSNFFMRLEIPEQSIHGVAVMILTLEVPVDSEKLPLIFDIDVMNQSQYDLENKEQIWIEFEKLRKFKNQLFFESITEKTKELFR